MAKFIFIQLRGGMDGLAALRPDDYSVLNEKRPDMLVDGYHQTNAGFAFHPALKACFDLFENGELSFLHACGLPVQDRSHFKSGDILASGHFSPIVKTGWLAKILELLPDTSRAMAFGSTIPLILKGSEKCFNWSSPQILENDEAFMKILGERLYKGDPELEDLYSNFLSIQEMTGGFRRRRQNPDPFKVIGDALSRQDNLDIGYISLGNWDTHEGQVRQIEKEFSNLDAGLQTLKAALGSTWKQTGICIVSEFGRSVHQNGTKGTDHGTGGLCLVTGGAIKGGQSLGRWPGLQDKDLFKQRDLMPVYDVRIIFAHILQAHLNIPNDIIETEIFQSLPEDYRQLDFIGRKRRLFGFV